LENNRTPLPVALCLSLNGDPALGDRYNVEMTKPEDTENNYLAELVVDVDEMPFAVRE